jgi:hypothetical protein
MQLKDVAPFLAYFPYSEKKKKEAYEITLLSVNPV